MILGKVARLVERLKASMAVRQRPTDSRLLPRFDRAGDGLGSWALPHVSPFFHLKQMVNGAKMEHPLNQKNFLP